MRFSDNEYYTRTITNILIMANIFVDGNLGKFDQTNDPSGNPPNDWNVSRDDLAILNFESDNPIEGDGGFRFSTKSIFNDNFGFKIQGSDEFNESSTITTATKAIEVLDLSEIDFTQDFSINFDFIPTEFYINGNQNILNLVNITNGFLRVVSGSATSNKITFAFRINGSNRNITSQNPLVLNEVNTIRFSITQGVQAELIVNGESVVDVSGLNTFNWNNPILTLSRQQYGGTTNRPVRGVYKNLELFEGVSKKYFYKFNQESGVNVFESMSEDFKNILVNYQPQDLAFEGGVWVDTTTL